VQPDENKATRVPLAIVRNYQGMRTLPTIWARSRNRHARLWDGLSLNRTTFSLFRRTVVGFPSLPGDHIDVTAPQPAKRRCAKENRTEAQK